MHKVIASLLLCAVTLCRADDTRSQHVPLCVQQAWMYLQKTCAVYVRCIHCHLEEFKVGKAPIPGAASYIRHRKTGHCRTYRAGKDFTEEAASTCKHHAHKDVLKWLARCSKAVTFHAQDGSIIRVEPDPVPGKRGSLPGGPYAGRLSS